MNAYWRWSWSACALFQADPSSDPEHGRVWLAATTEYKLTSDYTLTYMPHQTHSVTHLAQLSFTSLCLCRIELQSDYTALAKKNNKGGKKINYQSKRNTPLWCRFAPEVSKYTPSPKSHADVHLCAVSALWIAMMIGRLLGDSQVHLTIISFGRIKWSVVFIYRHSLNVLMSLETWGTLIFNFCSQTSPSHFTSQLITPNKITESLWHGQQTLLKLLHQLWLAPCHVTFHIPRVRLHFQKLTATLVAIHLNLMSFHAGGRRLHVFF